MLFVDDHKSYITLELSKLCTEDGIIFYALLPKITHNMQPADVSVFNPLKTEWKKNVKEWQLKPKNNNKVYVLPTT